MVWNKMEAFNLPYFSPQFLWTFRITQACFLPPRGLNRMHPCFVCTAPRLQIFGVALQWTKCILFAFSFHLPFCFSSFLGFQSPFNTLPRSNCPWNWSKLRWRCLSRDARPLLPPSETGAAWQVRHLRLTFPFHAGEDQSWSYIFWLLYCGQSRIYTLVNSLRIMLGCRHNELWNLTVFRVFLRSFISNSILLLNHSFHVLNRFIW
jgi:hypothetical protein